MIYKIQLNQGGNHRRGKKLQKPDTKVKYTKITEVSLNKAIGKER